MSHVVGGGYSMALIRSPSKKQWCCTQKKMGCEGATAPSVDAGAGMVWKRIKAWVNS